MSDELLYLASADIDAIGITPSRLRDVIRDAFANYSSSAIRVPPKQTVKVTSEHYFQAMAAVVMEPPFAALKWVGINGANSQKGVANVNGLVIVSEFDTGRPLAIIDGNRLTILRTSAMSALGAQYLASPTAKSLGFIGSGAQAFGHVAALLDALPSLRTAVCYDRRQESALALASHISVNDREGIATDDIDDVLNCDVIVSTVPSTTGSEPFLDARKLRPGALVIAVDMGRSWLPETLKSFDYFATDDRAQAADPDNRSKLAFSGPFDADLSELTSSVGKGRRNISDRILYLYPGFALADLAVASELYLIARKTGVGTVLLR